MRQFPMSRQEMAGYSPELIRSEESDPDSAADVRYFLALAVLPGCEAIPMEVEADPEAIRLWMERSLLFQARARVPGRPDRIRAVRGHVPVPARVLALVHMLAEDEVALDPAVPTLNARLNARLADPARDPEPAHLPRPGFRPAPRPF